MGSIVNMNAEAAAIKVAEFNEKPENLLLAIVYNNPELVSQNIQTVAGVSYEMTSEQIMDWFEQYGGELDEDALYSILDVPFNPDADNITADYWQVIEYQAMQLYGSGNSEGSKTWADLFPDAIQRLYDKYFAGQQATGEIGSDIDRNNSESQQQRQNQQRKTDRNRRIWKQISMVLNIAVLLSFLVFLVVVILSLSKNSKTSAS